MPFDAVKAEALWTIKSGERLDKSRLGFRCEMLQKSNATIEGIETAIGKGVSLRDQGEE